MQPMPATINARTERQAMDWSLVLVSQGIEAIIERDAESGAWRLVVDALEHQRALNSLRQYHIENRRKVVWQQQIPWTGLIFDWRCLLPISVFVFLFVVEAMGRGDLSKAGLMSNKAVHAGEWWRLFTAVTLHGDLAHLAANATTGLLLIGLTMGVYGAGIGLLMAFLAGVGGNLAGLLFYPETHRGLGASGMIMGALGLLAAQWLALLKHGITPRQLALRGVLSGGLLLVLLGFSPQQNVDVLAHVAGFLSGLLLGAALALCPPGFRLSRWLDHLGLLLSCGLVGGAWWSALRVFGRL